MTTDQPVDRTELFLAGQWRAPRDGKVVEVRNPADQRLVGRAALGCPADLDDAVAGARASFEAGDWQAAGPTERARVLAAAADLLEQRLEQVASLLTAELGCPHWFSRAAHLPNPIRHLRYYAQLARELPLAEFRTDAAANRSLVTQEPVGVVAAITPWNGPISTPSIKVAPALAAGCSVVLKPPPETPLAIHELGVALAEAGLPPGVLSIVPGDRAAGEHLVRHPAVDKVAFTGSTAAGKRVMALCAERIARVTLELGGKSAAVILDDADLTRTIDGLLPMALLVNGQACIAQTRVLVPRSREREVVDALAEALSAQPVGDPFAAGTKVGPMVSRQQRERVESYLALGRDEGARVVVGGGRPAGLDQGWFVEPTLFCGVDNTMRIAQEEIFGPVLAVISYDGDDAAVGIANDSRYGLSGSVWGTDEQRCLAVARRLRTGMVSINGRPQAYGTPFGGFKQSGLGREMGPEGLRSYLEPKTIAVGS